jgi:hypothetical protein
MLLVFLFILLVKMCDICFSPLAQRQFGLPHVTRIVLSEPSIIGLPDTRLRSAASSRLRSTFSDKLLFISPLNFIFI